MSLVKPKLIYKHRLLECDYVVENAVPEPMIGIAKLIQGNCYCNLGQHEDGIACFRQCLDMRKHLPYNCDDSHVSACAQYELGALLVHQPQVQKLTLSNLICKDP